MAKLESKIKNWIAQGLVSKDQGRDILLYEKEKSSKPWVLYGFLSLGFVVLGTGIISLIASNWESIPAGMKLGADFFLLLGVGMMLLRVKDKNGVFFEALLLFFMILCLASIGLISQVYHTGGELYQAIFLWLALTFGIAFYSKKLPIPLIWFLSLYLNSSYYFLREFGGKGLGLSLFLGFPLTFFILKSGISFFKGFFIQRKAIQIISVLAFLWSLFALEISNASSYEALWFWPMALLGILGSFLLSFSQSQTKVQKVLGNALVVVLLLTSLMYDLGVEFGILRGLPTVIGLLLLSLYFVSLQKRKLFQVFLIFVALRFLFFYFEALGGLALSGIGLILSGGIILFFAYLWGRYRSKLTNWAEGVLS